MEWGSLWSGLLWVRLFANSHTEKGEDLSTGDLSGSPVVRALRRVISCPIAARRMTSFDASQSAFYYARVIEIPTPRWTAYEALRFGVEMTPKCPDDDTGTRLRNQG